MEIRLKFGDKTYINMTKEYCLQDKWLLIKREKCSTFEDYLVKMNKLIIISNPVQFKQIYWDNYKKQTNNILTILVRLSPSFNVFKHSSFEITGEMTENELKEQFWDKNIK